MRILENLEPQDVFYYFEEICKIPHGSGNTGQISDYLKAFADEHGLYCRQDELNNIIMIKEASKGYEDHEPGSFTGAYGYGGCEGCGLYHRYDEGRFTA